MSKPTLGVGSSIKGTAQRNHVDQQHQNALPPATQALSQHEVRGRRSGHSKAAQPPSTAQHIEDGHREEWEDDEAVAPPVLAGLASPRRAASRRQPHTGTAAAADPPPRAAMVPWRAGG